MARRGNPSSVINANMTPMIDVTFALMTEDEMGVDQSQSITLID